MVISYNSFVKFHGKKVLGPQHDHVKNRVDPSFFHVNFKHCQSVLRQSYQK